MIVNPEMLDKQKVVKFFKSKGIEARFLSEQVNCKTPDFALYVSDKLWGYCELKSIFEDDWSGGLRSDPAYNNIQNKIHESCKQLKSINPNHDFPNIIFIINNHPHRGYQDLDAVLTGNLLPPGNQEVIDCKYLERLKEKDDIEIMDYIIWKDKDILKPYFFWVNRDSSFKDILKTKICSKMFEKTF